MNVHGKLRSAVPGALIAFLSTAGCVPGHFTGVGALPSAVNPSQHASLVFNLHARDTDVDGYADWWKGPIVYRDAPAFVHFLGTITESAPPDEFFPESGYFVGRYQPIPRSLGPGGMFDSFILDLGIPGQLDPEDVVDIVIYDGVFAGYYNVGNLSCGQVWYRP